MEASETSDEIAAPITRVIAKRVRSLRQEQNLNGPAFAKRLEDHGLNWNRTTLAKFETMRRASVTVQELLALALALNVPPVMLLADPRAVDQVPITADASLPAWSALLWMIGRLGVTLPGETRAVEGGHYQQSTELIHAGWSIVELVFELNRVEYSAFSDESPAEQQRRDDERHRAALLRLRLPMRRVLDMGAPLPDALTGVIYLRAKELDVAMPGMDG